jgi:hypothetical protein
MGYPTRTSSVRVCHFATSAGRLRISLEQNLSLKFNSKWNVGGFAIRSPGRSTISCGQGDDSQNGLVVKQRSLLFPSAVLLFALLLTLPLQANLGETVEQCVARYGKPAGFSEAGAKSPFGILGFTAGNYTLVIFVLKNKEVGARVSKQDKSAFTDPEMQTIMNADSMGSGWTRAASDDPTCLQWKREDKATVLYDKQKRMMIFTSQQMADALKTPSAPVSGAH